MIDIKFVTGVMGAGKSKELINNYYQSLNNRKYPLILTLSFTESNLTSTKVESRNGDVASALAISIEEQETLNFELLKSCVDNYDSIYVDESQFLNIKTIQQLLDICEEKNKEIVFYGLSRTFTGDYFEASEFFLYVLNKDSVRVIESFCEKAGCFNEAEWNARLIDGEIVTTGDVLLKEKSTYQSLCTKHFYRN